MASTHPELIILGNPHGVVIYWFQVSQEYIYSEYIRSEMAKLHFEVATPKMDPKN